jgi:hypothetical protein
LLWLQLALRRSGGWHRGAAALALAALRLAPRGCGAGNMAWAMMTQEQRYLLDLQGYLVVEGALSAEELGAAREAMDRYSGGVFRGEPPLPDDWYEGCREEHARDGAKRYDGHLKWAWAFDRAIESLCVHPAIWPIILELTQGKPQLSGPGERVGVAIVDDGEMTVADPHKPKANWHCNAEGHGDREGGGYDGARLEVREDGSLYCPNFVVFPYLDDVEPGDGGLFLIPGSHRGSFNRPRELFDWPGWPAPPPPGTTHVCPQAGDFVIMTEATTHAAVPWARADRQRRTLALRYQPHDIPPHNWFGEPNEEQGGAPNGWAGGVELISSRLAPESLELIQWAPSTHRKAIASTRVVSLSPPSAAPAALALPSPSVAKL